MKKWRLFYAVCVVVLVCHAAKSYAYDATGLWDYSPHSKWTTCPEPYDPEYGEIGILQMGSRFLAVDDYFSTYGVVNGPYYSFVDKFCEDYGVTTMNVVLTLSSETAGAGTVGWVWSDGRESCSGGHQLTLAKQAQAPPVYDVTGKWTFNQYGFSSNCDDATTPRASGYFEITQNGNRVTAIDDEGESHIGFIDGATYAVVQSYPEDDGLTTQWVIVTLNSDRQGSGTGQFVWDNDCDDCGGTWRISVTREIPDHTIDASAGPGGSIDPSGAVSVADGESQTFAFTPDPGYRVLTILYDDETIDARGRKTFSIEDVVENHTLKVLFGKIPVNYGRDLLLLDD